MKRHRIILVLLLISLSGYGQKIAVDGGARSISERKEIYEKTNIQLPPNAGAEEVKAAIFAQKPLILAIGSDLVLRHEIQSPGGSHYTFDQTWGGVPIYLAGIKANLSETNRIYSYLDFVQSFSGQPSPITRSTTELDLHLQANYDEGYPDFSFFHQPAYFLSANELVAVHLVVLTSNTMSWEMLLADSDLSELRRRDLASYRKNPHMGGTDTSGVAMVFNPDPLTTSGQVYGGAYTDNNDADSPALNDQRQQVTLRNITWDGVNFVLEGPYVKLEDREAPMSGVATTTDGNFLFTRSQQGFEDAMVYYHIDNYQRYVQSLGFMNLFNSPILADPHGLNGQDNSHFVPAGIDTRLAFGEGGVDDGEDADVIVHEYGHALSWSGSPGSNAGNERQGLDEGIGDYIAASYSKSLRYTFWKNTFTWDGHNEYWAGRSASDPTLYPPASANLYNYGTIWASTLMEVHDQIGRTASDRVLLQSLYGLAPNMTLRDAANVVLDADSVLYGGAYHVVYQDAFCRRGILTGALPGQGCFVGSADPATAILNWTVYPNPNSGVFNIYLEHFSPKDKLQYVVTDLLGRLLITGNIQREVTPIDASSLVSGSYLVKIASQSGTQEYRKINVSR